MARPKLRTPKPTDPILREPRSMLSRYMLNNLLTNKERAEELQPQLPELKAEMDAALEKYNRLYYKVRMHRDHERPESSRALKIDPQLREQLDEAKQRLGKLNTDTALLIKRRDQAERDYITARNKHKVAANLVEGLETGYFDDAIAKLTTPPSN